MTKNLIYLISSLIVLGCTSKRPLIKCLDLNKMSSDTFYYISSRHYEGFIFPKDYKPGITIEEERFTPSNDQVRRAEIILLEMEKRYGHQFKRQYIGSITPAGDSLVVIRLMKNGFREECFDTMVLFGFHGHYEKNQIMKTTNLSTGKLEE